MTIGARGRLVIDGLVFSGGALRLAAAADDEPRELVLRDCTLVPGLALNPDGSAASPGAPSLVVEHPFAKVTLERCITGPLQIVGDAEVTLTRLHRRCRRAGKRRLCRRRRPAAPARN